MLIRAVQISALVVVLTHSGSMQASELVIRVVDERSRELVPARVELLDSDGRAVVADDALPLSRECLLAPMPGWLKQPPPKRIFNPFTQTDQFYTTGVSRIRDMEPGDYTLRVFRGPEYHVQHLSVTVEPNEDAQVQVTMTRWFDAAARGWYGADDHLHLTRQTRAQGEQIGKWLAAEGLHVGHLLQMGTLTHFAAAPQFGFGEEGVQSGSGVTLLAGQEHPRTHLFGHAITLGANSAIDNRDTYALYTPTFSAGRQGGGVSGFAHWGIGPARKGLSFTATTGTVEFLEVLQFEFPHYDVWYQLLNLGIPIAATAGTDFPCLPGLPGRERFYTRASDGLDRASLVEGIRQGRTFVTNGPMISLTVNGRPIGSRITLTEPRVVQIAGELHFDALQDDMQSFELIRNGLSIPANVERRESVFHLTADVHVDRSSWFALRAVGEKQNEALQTQASTPVWLQSLLDQWIGGGYREEYTDYMSGRTGRESLAHTSAVYVDVGGATNVPTAQADPGAWLRELDELEALVASGDFRGALIWDWIPYSDGISAEHLRSNAPALLSAIEQARIRFEALRKSR